MANADWLKRERSALGAAMQRTSDPMYGPVIAGGRGSQVWDTEGRHYFDLTCGYSAANFGHAYEPLVRVAAEQLSSLTHVTGFTHTGRVRLAEALIEHCGLAGDRVIFNTSGAKAIETAVKIAWSHRPGKVVSIAPAYHGRSLATARLSDTPRVNSFAPEQCVQRPLSEFAYCQACPCQLTYPSCQLQCQDSLLAWLEQEHASISAILVEPAIGARGYIFPPADYWLKVREVTARYGILMIADEVQMGLGRAGHWLLSRHQGWQADLVVLGKSLGGGIVPISAVIGQSSLLDSLPSGVESETFAASPLATAIGCAVIEQLVDGQLFHRTAHLGKTLSAAVTWNIPGLEVQSFGAAVCIEFIKAVAERASAAALARSWATACLAVGLIVHYTGPFATRIILLPPLTMSDDELSQCCEILPKVFRS